MLIIFTEVIHKLKSHVTLAAWCAATLVCTLTGPFGTYGIDTFSHLLIFWGSVIFAGITYCLLCLHTMFNVFPNLRPLYSKLIAISFFTVTFAHVMYFIVDMIYVIPKPPPITQVYGVIGSVSFAVSAAIYWLHIKPTEDREKAQAAFATPPTPPSKPAIARNHRKILFKKLEANADLHIIRLNMRDHYVEVFSDQGAKLVHMRFAEAINDLSHINGMQVHRSHWVNFDDIKEIIKTDGKILFEMSDGAQIPISRLKQKKLRELGIL